MGNDIFDTISNKSVFTFLSEFDSVWTGKTNQVISHKKSFKISKV